MADDALQESALAGVWIVEFGRAPDHKVHRATDAIRYRIAQSSEPLPVDMPDEEHVDVAVSRITA
ncbi:MAG TPA: hypothetical protein DCK98_09205 [Chloroflexi bacterium]|nr:hypothetical protein [Chloroflexota bacterium]HAL28442.1 hypothetical protein [Chloroflexota bacterium]